MNFDSRPNRNSSHLLAVFLACFFLFPACEKTQQKPVGNDNFPASKVIASKPTEAPPPAPIPVPASSTTSPTPAPEPPAATGPAAGESKKEIAEPKVVEDKSYDYKLNEPQGWRDFPLSQTFVSGNPRFSWTPNNQTSITVFVQRMTDPPQTARTLLDEGAENLRQLGLDTKHKQGCKIFEDAVRDIGGKRAFSLVAVGRGNGMMLDGEGSLPTLQHWVGIPRETNVVMIRLTTPRDGADPHRKVFQTLLDSLSVGGTQTEDQKTSE